MVGIEEFQCIHRGVLISGGWNRGVPLYTEVSSFQVVGIEEFHCIHRGVLISGGWNRGVPVYTEVSSFQDRGDYNIIIKEIHWNQLLFRTPSILDTLKIQVFRSLYNDILHFKDT